MSCTPPKGFTIWLDACFQMLEVNNLPSFWLGLALRLPLGFAGVGFTAPSYFVYSVCWLRLFLTRKPSKSFAVSLFSASQLEMSPWYHGSSTWRGISARAKLLVTPATAVGWAKKKRKKSVKGRHNCMLVQAFTTQGSLIPGFSCHAWEHGNEATPKGLTQIYIPTK